MGRRRQQLNPVSETPFIDVGTRSPLRGGSAHTPSYPRRVASGQSRLDEGRLTPLATVLVRDGTLRQGTRCWSASAVSCPRHARQNASRSKPASMQSNPRPGRNFWMPLMTDMYVVADEENYKKSPVPKTSEGKFK